MSSNAGWPEAAPPSAPVEQLPFSSAAIENPPWNGWDVLRIGLLMFVVPYLVIPVVALGVQKLFYPGVPFMEVAQKPWLALSTQFAWYGVIAFYMVLFVEGTYRQRFWTSIRWNWPVQWPLLVPVGMVLVSLQGLERFFRLPKHIPMEEFLKTPLAAALTGILAVSIGPLMEELFFRGFFYPVLARRFGMIVGILATSVAFGLIHAAQLAFAWGLVLVVFLVGLVLTIVRAKTRSVASSFIVHVAYNTTLVVLGIFAGHQAAK
ncbi:MAG TPA: type II CAAX endopeptidase family protein [Terriglobales bacterium]|nr:type II CAAX endopeptidase family protein [Terriglobales bacterium]